VCIVAGVLWLSVGGWTFCMRKTPIDEDEFGDDEDRRVQPVSSNELELEKEENNSSTEEHADDQPAKPEEGKAATDTGEATNASD